MKVTIDLPPEAAEGLLKAFANRDAGLFRTLRPLLLKGIRDRGEIFVVSGIDKSDYFDEDDCESLSLEVTSQVAKTCREVGVQMIHLITTSTLDEIYFEAIEPSDIIKRHVSECQTCKAKLTETRRLIKQGPERMEVFKKSDLPSMSLPLCVFYLNSTTQDLADFTRETLALTNELIWIWSPGERADPGFDPNDGTKERSRSRRSRSK